MGRTLHVDRDAHPSHDRVHTLEEALASLVAAEYDTVVLYTRTPGRDDYGLIDYLAGTWPHFLQTLTVRYVCTRATPAARPRRLRAPRTAICIEAAG